MARLVCLFVMIAMGLAFPRHRLGFRELLKNRKAYGIKPNLKVSSETLWFDVPVDHINRDAGTF
jgi:hypothetical protein